MPLQPSSNRTTLICFLMIQASIGLSVAQTIPTGGVDVISQDSVSGLSPIKQTTTQVEYSTLRVTGQTFTVAIQAMTKIQPATTYGLQMSSTSTDSLTTGDVALVTFWARAIAATDESGEAMMGVVFERRGDPYTKSLSTAITLAQGGAWKQYFFPFSLIESYSTGGAHVNIMVGYKPQTIQIGGLRVINYKKSKQLADLPKTPITWVGMDAGAAWRTTAAQRIDQLRKGDLTVIVKDRNGRSVTGATVTATMKKHAFSFGSAVVCSRIMDTTTVDNRTYASWIKKLFNRVVIENELKWPGWENAGQRARTLAGIRWLRDQGIDVRGHNLVWPSWKYMPSDVQTLATDSAALRKRVDAHITDEVTALKGQIAEWDVINEPYANHDLMDILGRLEMVRWFKLARQADSVPTLFINDYSILSGGGNDLAHQNNYDSTIHFLIDNGAPIGGIGMQSHFGETPTSTEKLWKILDRFDSLNLSIESTEFDIKSVDRTYQAAYLKDFMTALFAHPSVTGIVMWGFWAKAHWIPEAALFDSSWTIRPHGQAWIDLVTKEWWTNASGTSGSAGSYAVRGFLGDYEVTASLGTESKTVSCALLKTGTTVEVVFDATPVLRERDGGIPQARPLAGYYSLDGRLIPAHNIPGQRGRTGIVLRRDVVTGSVRKVCWSPMDHP